MLIWGMMVIISLAFISVEKLLPDGWYYVPATANLIAIILSVIWSGIAAVIIWHYSMIARKRVTQRTVKGLVTVITSLIYVCIVFLLLFNCWGYCAKHQEKVEQYDEHLALYVKNTFVRPEARNPNYKYEENWLFMRSLSDDELNDAIQKYGSPNDYYN